MINEDLLPIILIVEPELSVGPQEEVDGDVTRQRVEWRLSEARDDGTLTLDRDHFGKQALGSVDGRVVNLVRKKR